MKRYGNIYEKIASVENLKEAHRMARADGFDKIKGGNTNHARQWKGLRWKGMGCSDSCA